MKSAISVNDMEWKPFQVEKSQGYEFKFGIVGSEYTDAYSVDLVKIAPGGYSPVHTDPDNHAFYFIQGTGSVVIAGKPVAVAPGSVVKIPFGVVHAMHNSGPDEMVFITIYDPPRVRLQH
jgi:quercetin dioxygenase-like cupin family protein